MLHLAETLKSLGGPDILVLVSARPPNPLRETLKEDEQSRWDQAYSAQLWTSAAPHGDQVDGARSCTW